MIEVGSIFLTRRCNLRCGYCGIWRERVRELSPEEWYKVLEPLKDKVRFWNVPGGEPTQYPRLEEMIRIFGELDFDYVLCSNVFDVSVKDLDRWLSLGLPGLSVSIDGLDFADPSSFYDHSSFLKSFSGWSFLDFPFPKGFIKLIGVAVSKKTLPCLERLIEVATEKDWYLCINLVQTRKELHDLGVAGGDFAFSEQDRGLVAELSAWLAEKKRQGYHLADPPEYFEAMARHGIAQDWHCTTPSILVVDADGSFRCCWEFKGERVPHLSSSGFSLEEFEQARREDVKKCPGCFWNCFWMAEQMYLGRVPRTEWRRRKEAG